MRHARTDYESIQPYPTKRPHIVCDSDGSVLLGADADRLVAAGEALPRIPDDEPVMVFRAKDRLGSMVVDFYADLLIQAGADKEMVDLVIRWAAEMRRYRDEHYPADRVPDVDKAFIRRPD